MRLSLKKGAHAVLSRAAYRKFGASRSFFARCGIPQVYPSSLSQADRSTRVPLASDVGGKRWATRISYFTAVARTTYAVSLKGNRMMLINATNLDRKSGGSPPQPFVSSKRLADWNTQVS
jgi:hypothetical protein